MRNYKIMAEKDLQRYGAKILTSGQFRKAGRQKHHLRASVAEHSVRVARASLKIAYALDNFGIRTDKRSLVIGSLCHDLGMLGRDEKYKNNAECCRRHPGDSVEESRKLVPDIDLKTQQIIERHMFPLNGRPPTSLEGAIVSAADKYASVQDLILG